MEEKILYAALAGLLHDVGKAVQRSRPDPRFPPQDARDEKQPVHAAWSFDFIEKTPVPQPFRAPAIHGAYHHRPEYSPAADRSLSYLVALADKLSAGERIEQEKTDVAPVPQMISIFDSVSVDSKAPRSLHYLPLSPLKLEKASLFPTDKRMEKPAQAYEKLVAELRAAASRSDLTDPESYLENLLSAFQRATWCIPSAYYYDKPDISLYDHSRMTAALAVCLTDFSTEDVQTLNQAVFNDWADKPQAGDADLLNKPAALLVGGDISGVQNFIYTISSKGAARTLRGRSFYLQLLTEAVLRYVLNQLGLPYTNVIYSGGGHFYLLAPLSAASRLPGIRRQITEKLIRHHGTALYLALGYDEIPFAGFKAENFSGQWGKMHAALSTVKRQRYTELGDDLYSLVFQPKEHGGNREDTCAVCGEERTGTRLLDPEDVDEAGTENRICPVCASFENQIGKKLAGAQFVILGLGEPKESPARTALDTLAEFGLSVHFAKDASDQVDLLGDDTHPKRAIIWALDDPDKWIQTPGIPSARFLRYTINHVPEGLSFNELSEKAEGIERLGVLRMDADDMGKLFQTGFQRDQKSFGTLSRISTLSFQISLYFEGWVKNLVESEDYKKLIYAVYAGGDDLFLIAPWHIVPDLALRIEADLNQFSGGNPAIHASAGISFIHGKYPVYQAADDAAKALEKAKRTGEKNAVTFLDTPWKWDDFAKLNQYKDQLVKIVNEKGKGGLDGPQSLLTLLRWLADTEEAARNQRKKKKPERVWGPWMWKGEYQLKRMLERAEKDKNVELKQALSQVHQQVSTELYENLFQWGKAARWAQILVREKTDGRT
ncbi:MAG TPA: type III-A CRISPR-associated protein Cas10/Csm1 [Anaerolineaceae bacterium]